MWPSKFPSNVYVVEIGPDSSITLPRSCKITPAYSKSLSNDGYRFEIAFAKSSIDTT